MFKFIKRAYYIKGAHKGQIVITYSVSEIIIGLLLVSLVAFYIFNYLEANLNPPRPPMYGPGKPLLLDQNGINSITMPAKKTK